ADRAVGDALGRVEAGLASLEWPAVVARHASLYRGWKRLGPTARAARASLLKLAAGDLGALAEPPAKGTDFVADYWSHFALAAFRLLGEASPQVAGEILAEVRRNVAFPVSRPAAEREIKGLAELARLYALGDSL